MFKKLQTVSLMVLGLAAAAVSPAFAALEAQNSYMLEIAKVAAPDHQQARGTVCIPPEPQYFSTFIRDIDSTIVGIHYDIVEYVC